MVVGFDRYDYYEHMGDELGGDPPRGQASGATRENHRRPPLCISTPPADRDSAFTVNDGTSDGVVTLSHLNYECLMASGDLPVCLADLIRRPAWMTNAACRGMDAALFFPDAGGPTALARAVCSACPVREPCLQYALEENVAGVWAGTSPRQRATLRRQASYRPRC